MIFTSYNIFVTHVSDTTILDVYSILDTPFAKVMSQTINQVTMHK